jgi:hypothetical protein
MGEWRYKLRINLGTRWRWVLTSSRSLYPQGKFPVPSAQKAGSTPSPQIPPEFYSSVRTIHWSKIIFPLPGIDPRFISRSAPSPSLYPLSYPVAWDHSTLSYAWGMIASNIPTSPPPEMKVLIFLTPDLWDSRRLTYWNFYLFCPLSIAWVKPKPRYNVQSTFPGFPLLQSCDEQFPHIQHGLVAASAYCHISNRCECALGMRRT